MKLAHTSKRIINHWTEWCRWFAWFPVPLDVMENMTRKTEWVWLEVVEWKWGKWADQMFCVYRRPQ